MSLITRCPTCETMFRVVPDQLRVSEGWVRCGQCAHVFDATQNMVQTPGTPHGETTAPTQVSPLPPPPPQRPSPPPLAHPPPPLPTAASSAQPATEIDLPPMAEVPRPLAKRSIPVQVPSPETKSAPTVGATDGDVPRTDMARVDEWLDGPPTDPQTAILQTQGTADALPYRKQDAQSDRMQVRDDSAVTDTSTPKPSFLRSDAQEVSLWRRPAMRRVLLVVVLVLLALLGAQFLIKERNRVAAVQPALRPVLQALCSVVGCNLAPLRQIESIVIDSSSFSRVRDDDYRLGFSLKNTAPIEVAMPAIELSLTDPQDRPVVRRVIMPAEFGARSAALASGTEWSGSLALTVKPGADVQRIAGYRLLAFYP